MGYMVALRMHWRAGELLISARWRVGILDCAVMQIRSWLETNPGNVVGKGS